MRFETECGEEALLLDFLEECLDPERRSEVRRHLESCRSCRADLEGLRKTLGLAANATRPQQNPLFASGFQYEVRQGVEARRRTKIRWRLAGLAAACVCVAFWFSARFEAGQANPEVAGVQQIEDSAVVDDAGEELASLIDAYLLETASTDELMRQVATLNSAELIAMYEEDKAW